MKRDSRFKERQEGVETVQMILDGDIMTAQIGDSVAAAILAYSANPSRHTAMGSPRAAYCMMGVCFDCLVEVDGRPNVQGCMTLVREGMVLRRQNGLRPISGVQADD